MVLVGLFDVFFGGLGCLGGFGSFLVLVKKSQGREARKFRGWLRSRSFQAWLVF